MTPTPRQVGVRLRKLRQVHRFDKRSLEFDADPPEVPTKDKKYIWVDAYARWRIIDPLRFYQAVGDERRAQSGLDDVTYGQTRNAVASFDLIELVRSGDRPFQITEELEGIGAAEAMAKIMSGRERIAQIVLKRAAEMTPPTASSWKTCASVGSATWRRCSRRSSSG